MFHCNQQNGKVFGLRLFDGSSRVSQAGRAVGKKWTESVAWHDDDSDVNAAPFQRIPKMNYVPD
jgi:hypothetical protein